MSHYSRYHCCTADGLELVVTARSMQDAVREVQCRLADEPIIVMAWREARGTPVPCPYLPRRATPVHVPDDSPDDPF